MSELQTRARQLLETKAVSLIIGYGSGFQGKPRPIFIDTPEAAAKLIWNEQCVQNLAVYLLKPEVKASGKIGIIAALPAMLSVLQLAAENQIRDGEVVLLNVSADGRQVSELSLFSDLETWISQNMKQITAADREKMSALENKSREERWQYWLNEFSRCIKCYACRAACPLCYCSSCTVDCNQPQWISVPAHTLGNLEWHVMRAMHLAGRCINCGECARACPVDLPIHLLTFKLSDDIKDAFGQQAGIKARPDYALSTFKPDDKENFIR